MYVVVVALLLLLEMSFINSPTFDVDGACLGHAGRQEDDEAQGPHRQYVALVLVLTPLTPDPTLQM